MRFGQRASPFPSPRPSPSERGRMLRCLSAQLSAGSARRTSRATVPAADCSFSLISVFLVARAGFVAQIFNLPYRRLAVGRLWHRRHASALSNVWRSATLRYSRVQLCATTGDAKEVLSPWERFSVRATGLALDTAIRTIPAIVEFCESSRSVAGFARRR